MATTWDAELKGGAGWVYNQDEYTYNEDTDDQSGAQIKYNSSGTGTTFTLQTKS